MDALKSIPNEEKGSYLRVQSRCPELLQRESCFSRFLRFERGCLDAATKRFVGYWEKRAAIFGCDRASLPISLIEGNLSESCSALIRAGLVAVLPPDTDGRFVCFLDMTIEEVRHPSCHEDRLHCFFYALQVVSEETSSQTRGFNLIILYDDCCYAPSSAIEGFEDILSSMPIRVEVLHLIPARKIKDDTSFFQEFVPRVLKTLISSQQPGCLNVLEYMDEPPLQILSKLEKKGLRRQDLPSKIGGGWTSAHHVAWIRSRLTKEAEIRKKDVHGASFPNSADTTGAPSTHAGRKRSRETKHCKQKRDRKSCRVKALCLHIQHLEDKKKEAHLVHQKLLNGLAEARKITKQIELNRSVSQNHALGPMEFPRLQQSGMCVPSSAYQTPRAAPFSYSPPYLPHNPPPFQVAGALYSSAPLRITIILPGSSLPVAAPTQPSTSSDIQHTPATAVATRHPTIQSTTHQNQQVSFVDSASLHHVGARLYGSRSDPSATDRAPGGVAPLMNCYFVPPDSSNAHFSQTDFQAERYAHPFYYPT